jgi:hypothetical protein
LVHNLVVSSKRQFSVQIEVPVVDDAVERYGGVEMNGMVYFPLAFAYSA